MPVDSIPGHLLGDSYKLVKRLRDVKIERPWTAHLVTSRCGCRSFTAWACPLNELTVKARARRIRRAVEIIRELQQKGTFRDVFESCGKLYVLLSHDEYEISLDDKCNCSAVLEDLRGTKEFDTVWPQLSPAREKRKTRNELFIKCFLRYSQRLHNLTDCLVKWKVSITGLDEDYSAYQSPREQLERQKMIWGDVFEDVEEIISAEIQRLRTRRMASAYTAETRFTRLYSEVVLNKSSTDNGSGESHPQGMNQQGQETAAADVLLAERMQATSRQEKKSTRQRLRRRRKRANKEDRYCPGVDDPITYV
ncbi:hypothetical protein MMC10_000276 [Thelotrema lepadinum]|nr:hypothetical protein [Thelotrema lepadinum]